MSALINRPFNDHQNIQKPFQNPFKKYKNHYKHLNFYFPTFFSFSRLKKKNAPGAAPAEEDFDPLIDLVWDGQAARREAAVIFVSRFVLSEVRGGDGGGERWGEEGFENRKVFFWGGLVFGGFSEG